DIKAPREVENQVATENNRDNAVQLVGKRTIKIPINKQVIEDIDELFSVVRQLNGVTQSSENNNETLSTVQLSEKEKIAVIKEKKIISDILYENYQVLVRLDTKNADELQTFLKKTMTTLYEVTTINENKPEEIKMAQGIIAAEFNNSSFTKDIREMGMSIANVEVFANTTYDEETTEALIQEARKSVKSVMIKKDQIIVKEGEPITYEQKALLESLGLLSNVGNFEWPLYLSLAGLVCLVLLLQWFYLYKYHPEIFNDTKKLIMLNILSIIAILLARILGIISLYVIPLACIPILMTILINDEVAIAVNILNCILISVAVKFNLEITILAVLNSITAVMLLKKMQQRNDILYSSIYIGLINLAMYLSMGFLLSNSIVDVFTKAGLVLLASSVSGVLAIGFLPFFESLFDVVTTVKLLELSNPNHPLLKRLLLEAPGTYHHSILVSNLAEQGAKAIEADSLIARVGAYYHDIGKISRPLFFIENQEKSLNVHEKMDPRKSTS
ncbi:MAG: HDIG domain-containing protein, partial [Clostridiaceae bacterium]|nr:HDIG domain-containing protein [Clostridiaceae bacterium]